jgi:hypothetical protein
VALAGHPTGSLDPPPAAVGQRPQETSLVGEVQDAEGRPIVGVRVELTVEGRPVAATFTGPDGGFRLSLARAGVGMEGDARRVELSLDRLGYRPLVHPLTPEALRDARGRAPAGDPPVPPRTEGATVPLLLIMETAPLPLPGFQVEADMEPCPAGNHPEAAALWEAMARWNASSMDTLGAASYTLVRTDTLPPGGMASEATERLLPGQRGFSGRLHLAWERRLDRDGYAFPVRRTDTEGSFDAWSYAPLEADFASHFATPRFLEHHRLRAPSPTLEGGWILAYCAPSLERPALEGHLELSGDTLLLRAEWRFRTPEPDEEAGGWARFPGIPGEGPLLLPLESVTWRTLRGGAVQRRAQWYEAWIVTPGDSVPFLPDRAPGGG